MKTGAASVLSSPPIDGDALRERLSAAAALGEAGLRDRVRALLSAALEEGRAALARRLAGGARGWELAQDWSRLADEIVSALYDFTTTHVFRARNPTSGERLAVVATGGYGRGELAPFSDLDLLFLRTYKQTPFAESVTEYMLYLLWDLGLKVSQASRSVEECIKHAEADHTIQTALLEARFLVGDASLFQDLEARFQNQIVARAGRQFIAAKLAERDARHQRAGASRYMVEPNIKDGKGGLRDLHTLFWIVRHRYGFSSVEACASAGLFSAGDAAAFRRARDFMWTVRCHLHLIAGRAEERLSFEVQPELAQRLGYKPRHGHAAAERFMKRYFIAAKQIGALTRVICARLEAEHTKRAPRGLERLLPAARRLRVPDQPGDFFVENGRLTVASGEIFNDKLNLLRLFQLADARGLDVHPVALGEAARRSKTITEDFRRDQRASALFLEIVASPRHPAAALKLMNEAGVLGRFVPEFGRIVAQMQFNMYHHFTVDEHTLQGIEALSEIEHGRHSAPHPLATAIFPKIINRRALYLAMLLHDTGKGEGDQQIEGEKSAREACTRMGLPAEEIELVAWLVGHHLMMNDVAQKRDIGDPRTVAQFARQVGSLENLRMLLVLTVADIRAVGAGLWNDWKGQLLRDLYRLTEAAFHGGRSDEDSVRARLAEIADEARAEVLDQIGRENGEAWVAALEDNYWLSHDRDARSWHAGEIARVRSSGSVPHVAARMRQQQGVTEILVYACDRPGLFASLAAAITASGGDIAHARVHTTRDGFAFDVFSVQTSDRRPLGQDHPRTLEQLLERVARAAVTDHPTPTPKPPAGRAAAFRIEPWVRIDNELSADATVVEASGRDRPGLLAELARVLTESGVSIVSAHLEPYGERVSDVFYVQEEGGGPIRDAARIVSLGAAIEAVLRAQEPPDQAGEASMAVARASTAR